MDIGKQYFSSSLDKEFIKDQLNNPQDYKYKVIKTYNTRAEAIRLEIKLHNKFNVGVNEAFYNRAKQTSAGWDTTGRSDLGQANFGEKNGMFGKKHSGEVKRKCAEAAKGNTNWLGRTHTEESKKKIKEARAKQIITDEVKRKMSDTRSGIGNGMFGKKHTEESIQKMKEKLKGRIPWNKGLKKHPAPIDIA